MEVGAVTTVRPTAKPIFGGAAERLQIDAEVLYYLFGQCLLDLLNEADSAGTCTIRGLGRFKTTKISELVKPRKGQSDKLIVFERTKHPQTKTPFAAYALRSRINSAK